MDSNSQNKDTSTDSRLDTTLTEEESSEKTQALPKKRQHTSDFEACETEKYTLSCERVRSAWRSLKAFLSAKKKGPFAGLRVKVQRYERKNEVGRGGMSTVVAAFDQDLGRYSALKIAKPDVVRDSCNAQYFVREARIMAKLEHPNIMPVHDLGMLDTESPFFAMKLFHGESLERILRCLVMGKDPYISRFDRYHLLQIFVKVCDAVSFAHSNDVIHCDIKPANIMVGPFGEVLLTDWGIACDLNDPIQSPESPGRSVVRGTPAYMAPEMAESRALEIDKLTDIFLMGATLYHIITQEPPYVGPNTWNVAYKAARCDFPHPSERRPGLQIPSELSRIVLKTMALKKSDRYQSVEELKRDLESFLAGNSRTAQRKYLPGDMLIRAGDRGAEAYLIVTGCVEVVKKAENGQAPLVLATLGPGDIVGEMALVTGEVRSANVVAREETFVEIITLEQMRTELKKLAPWMEKMVIALAERLRETDARIRRS